ncbi:uncharacterized protein Gasu_61640 [Galdieria sulphuraria]|uniref:Uncharacterized protein n=1 Tax=Galdieria sulphuraria TaxID=130081 RepID=M2VSR5_GALSU|nr:uncharacterized protein Gasu_61640 [Galdieria sulphuraria]EME26191.1 hypothetical protein Gasu_61640 [Galdieria sulphuraria]|eukprot:XP_005702711.1 hypothetical protein Gasu_61640 [Galdieria sulphuraria]
MQVQKQVEFNQHFSFEFRNLEDSIKLGHKLCPNTTNSLTTLSKKESSSIARSSLVDLRTFILVESHVSASQTLVFTFD